MLLYGTTRDNLCRSVSVILTMTSGNAEIQL